MSNQIEDPKDVEIERLKDQVSELQTINREHEQRIIALAEALQKRCHIPPQISLAEVQELLRGAWKAVQE
jgi:chromosome condensin MukBEF ATPase and DNA-binding subunit MukB